MPEDKKPMLDMIQRQLKELEAISQQVSEDLNIVGGTERVAKWKARTVLLIAQQLGPKEAQQLAEKHPGPSFTNDMFEEFTDIVDFYRSAVTALAKIWSHPSSGPR